MRKNRQVIFMNLQQMEYFVAIAETKSITLAAKKLFISQPPMSRQLALLEKEIGAELLVRTNRGVELTSAGEIFYAKCCSILDAIHDMKETVQEAASGIRGQIKIGTIYTAVPLLAQVTDQFHTLYPNVTFYVEPSLPDELLRKLEKGTVDVALLRSPMSETGNFPYMKLGEEPLVLALHERMDPVPNEEEIDIHMLNGISFCAQIRAANWDFKNWDYNALLRDECRKNGFDISSIYECNGALAALMLTCAGIAACYIPRSVFHLLRCEHIHLKQIRGLSPLTEPILLWNNTNYTSRCLRTFLDFVQDFSRSQEDLVLNKSKGTMV